MVQVTLLRRTLVYTSFCQQGHVGSKALLQQSPPALNWGCRLMQVIMNNGCKMVIVRNF